MRVLAIVHRDDYLPVDVIKINPGEGGDETFVRWFRGENHKWATDWSDDDILSEIDYDWREYEV